ncbi:MAG: aldehyde dehydrogenase family protein [Verrucomicrobia bacterium]|nr:aldehyde dehydrogenase family protein [Verrucomicrobiota bacterium]MDA1086321.1 aldehyde dehydrogenase family protein [Verrucomicrobiota bacterium]
MSIPLIPAYRFGETYESLDVTEITNFRSGDPLARVGSVNAGVIRRDLRRIDAAFTEFQKSSVGQMLAICARAADLFMQGDVPVSEGALQSPQDYVEMLSATGGLPHALVRGNMEKIAHVLREMPTVLKGLTRGLDVEQLQEGVWQQDGLTLSYAPSTTHLGVVLPSNSPGVNSLWLPAVALRVPVLLKPGREDPWTPWRIINALLAAGCPGSAFGFYPTDHEGADVVSSSCKRVILFGDAKTVERHTANPNVSVHGPGYSKVILGADEAENWESHIDLMADSVVHNGGRSCVNASTIVVPAHGRDVARRLAERLAEVKPTSQDDPAAQLAAFLNLQVADAIEAMLNQGLGTPGAEDVSEPLRGSRVVDCDGLRYLLPTVVYCEKLDHPLAKSEYLFPYVSVVEIAQDEVLDWIGPTLVGTVISSDETFRRASAACADIDRLNLGAVPTPTVQWDQPHEGNLFEWLYHRRAIQVVS